MEGTEVLVAVHLAYSTAGFVAGSVIALALSRKPKTPQRIIIESPLKVEIVNPGRDDLGE